MSATVIVIGINHSMRHAGGGVTATLDLVLIYCQKCRNPIGKLARGSAAEFFCWRCRLKTFKSLPQQAA